MDIVAITFILIMWAAITVAAGALCYGLDARWEDTLALHDAQIDLAEQAASDAWQARALRPRNPHVFSALVDLGALYDAPRAQARLAAAPFAGTQGERAGTQGERAGALTAYRYRAFVGHAEWVAHRCAAPEMQQRPWEHGDPTVRIEPVRTLHVVSVGDALPVSGSARSPRFVATVGRPALSLVLARNVPDAAPMAHPFESRVRRDSGVQPNGTEARESARTDAWGRYERPRRLSASELYALRAPSLQPSAREAS